MALDKYTCVSLQDARLFLGKSDTDTADDQLLDLHAQTASGMVAKALGMEGAVTRARREFHDGHGGKNLWLNNYPVSSVDHVAVGQDDALTIEYTGSDSSYATVEVTQTHLKLRKRVSGVLTATTLALADYATLALLEAAVEAVSGWTVVVTTGFTTYSPISLVPAPARGARDSTITLGVPDEGEVDCELSPEWGRLYNPYGWVAGHRNICVEYTAGWDRGEMPAPIRGACLELVKMLYDRSKKDLAVRSETIGDYSYSLAGLGDVDVDDLLGDRLKDFRRTVVMGA